MNKIEELRAALEAATGGEWKDDFTPGTYSEGLVSSGDYDIAIMVGANYGAWRDSPDAGEAEFAANARLIALMKNTLPALLEAAEALETCQQYLEKLSDLDDKGAASAWAGVAVILEKLK